MVLVCSSLALLIASACPDQPQSAATNPAPSVTYDRPVSPVDSIAAKQAAILGAPSRLQQMAMQQAGDVSAAAPSLAPASGGLIYQARPAIVEHGASISARFHWTPASPDRP